MAYRVVIKKLAEKELAKLDNKAQTILVHWMLNNLEACDDPRSIPAGKALAGIENGWRWRVGIYRILAVIDDTTITIEVFRIGHRRDVYRGC